MAAIQADGLKYYTKQTQERLVRAVSRENENPFDGAVKQLWESVLRESKLPVLPPAEDDVFDPFGVPSIPDGDLVIGKYGEGISLWEESSVSPRINATWYGLNSGSVIPENYGILADKPEGDEESHRSFTNEKEVLVADFKEAADKFGENCDFFFLRFIIIITKGSKAELEAATKALSYCQKYQKKERLNILLYY